MFITVWMSRKISKSVSLFLSISYGECLDLFVNTYYSVENFDFCSLKILFLTFIEKLKLKHHDPKNPHWYVRPWFEL